MDAKAEKIALFRFGVIAPLVLEPLPRGELTRRAQEIAARHYEIPGSQRTSVSVDTLLDWAVRYRNGGFEALAPQPRQDRGQPRTITPQLADLIERLKRENPHRTGTTLLRELALSSGQDTAGSPPPPCTASSNSAACRSANCSLRRRTRSSKLSTATRSGSLTCSMVPMSSAPAAARCKPCCMRSSTTRAGSSRTPSSTPARAWTPAWTAYARPLPPAACPCGSIWITPRSIAARNWRGLRHPSACSSCTLLRTSPRAAGKSNVFSARAGNNS